MTTVLERDPIKASDSEKPAIQDLERRLASLDQLEGALVGPNGDRLPLPVSVYSALVRVVSELARGNAVAVVPIHAELTTQQAADLMGVSRPFVVKLLDEGKIPHRKVERHRRIRFDDLMRYLGERDRRREEAVAEMARDAQIMGSYD